MKKGAILKKIERIDALLAETYGAKKQETLRDPTEELIVTILSQNTNDRNRDRAFESLKKRFPGWGDAARARPDQIACVAHTLSRSQSGQAAGAAGHDDGARGVDRSVRAGGS